MEGTGMFAPYEVNWASEVLGFLVFAGIAGVLLSMSARSSALAVMRWFLGISALVSVLTFPRVVLALSPDAVAMNGFWVLGGMWLLATRAPKVPSGPPSGPHHEHL